MKIPFITPYIQKRAMSIVMKSTSKTGKTTTPDFWTQAWLGISGDKNYKNYIMNGFASNPFVYMVISSIARDISRLSYNITNNEREITTGNLFKIFQKPNEEQSWQEFMELLSLNFLTGEVFILDENSVGFENRIISLKVLNNQWVTARLSGQSELEGWEYYEKGKYLYYPKESIIHIKYPNIVYNEGERAFRGFSPLEPIKDVFESSNSIFTAENAIFQNGGILGMLTNDSDVPMLPTEREKVEADWKQRNSGAGNFGKIKITNSKLRYLKIGITPKDLEMNEANLAKLRVICSMYGVDSRIFGDPSSTTYNNMSEANKGYFTKCIIPTTEFILNKFNQYVQNKIKTLEKISFDKTKIDALKEVNEALTNNVVAQLNAQLIGINEAQTLLGLPITERVMELTTLNGAQVTSLITLLQSTTGVDGIPPAVIRPVIIAAFPSIPPNLVDDIVNGFKK
jgi:HK97 family phage portal protein